MNFILSYMYQLRTLWFLMAYHLTLVHREITSDIIQNEESVKYESVNTINEGLHKGGTGTMNNW